MQSIESLKEIERAADKGWWIAKEKVDYEVRDLFEHIRFNVEKIKEENNLDYIWKPIKP